MGSSVSLGVAQNDGILLSNPNRPKLWPKEERWRPACDWFPGWYFIEGQATHNIIYLSTGKWENMKVVNNLKLVTASA